MNSKETTSWTKTFIEWLLLVVFAVGGFLVVWGSLQTDVKALKEEVKGKVSKEVYDSHMEAQKEAIIRIERAVDRIEAKLDKQETRRDRSQ